MSLPTSQNAWLLAERPTDELTEGNFTLRTRPVPGLDDLKEGQVLVKNTLFSNDPAQRLWMDGSVDPVRHHLMILSARLCADITLPSVAFISHPF